MAERHEEKYLIDYRQYALLKARAQQVLQPDPNGVNGQYTITSLYYDDPLNTALLEKQDGLVTHTKFRIRTYDSQNGVIRLERKVKTGIITQKQSAALRPEQLRQLGIPHWDTEGLSEPAAELVLQMMAAGLRPVMTVRYRRDAFVYPGTDIRLTFDTALEALSPEPEMLFAPRAAGIPVLSGNAVIMEIKYGSYLPSFLRTLTAGNWKQLSVSKYALCREVLE